MASAQEVIRFVKNKRGESCKYTQKLGGTCLTGTEVAFQFGGQHWRSHEAISHPDQKYPQHTVAVIPIREESGVIVDFTNNENTIIGSIQDINNQGETSKAIEEATGFGGWEKQRIIRNVP